MKYCHVRHLLPWTLNYQQSNLEVRFPACVSKDIFYGLLLHFLTWESNLPILHSTQTCIRFANKQIMCYLRLLGQVSVTPLPWRLCLHPDCLYCLTTEPLSVQTSVCYETCLTFVMSSSKTEDMIVAFVEILWDWKKTTTPISNKISNCDHCGRPVSHVILWKLQAATNVTIQSFYWSSPVNSSGCAVA